MAKNMARIENGIVVNVEWCSDRMIDTDTLKDTEGRPIKVGDSYSGGKFYRGEEEILRDVDKLAKYEQALLEYEQALLEIESALGV